jgi:hypothetical protein
MLRVRSLRNFVPLAGLGLCAFGCHHEQAEFSYGKAEMEGQIVGTWTGTWLPEGAEASTFILELDSLNDPSRRRTACGRQTFSADPAPGVELACMAGSSLAVTGILSVADPGFEMRELGGSFEVSGIDLAPGYLSLASDDQAVWLSAHQDQSYGWQDCLVSVDGTRVACTLDTLDTVD